MQVAFIGGNVQKQGTSDEPTMICAANQTMVSPDQFPLDEVKSFVSAALSAAGWCVSGTGSVSSCALLGT